jgi:5'-nucleotidase
MTGAQLHLALEQQWQVASNGTSVYSPLAVSESLHYRFDLTAPIGRRIDPSKLTIHGKSLELTASYKVAANSYTILGQDGFSTLTVFENPVRHTLDKEGFIRFLRGRTITPPALDRGLPV